MPLVRKIARPLLASSFITGGIDQLRNTGEKVQPAEKVVSSVPDKVSFIKNTEQLVKIDAAAKVIGGILLASGRLPRPAALGLAISLVPTTLAGHRFWEERDAGKKKTMQRDFLKNLSMLGGLLLAAVDTEGKPSLAWRTRKAASGVSALTSDQFSSVGGKLAAATSSINQALPTS